MSALWQWLGTNYDWLVPTLINAALTVLLIINARKQNNIAKQNSDIAQQEIKLSLYNKRYEIYKSFAEALSTVIKNPDDNKNILKTYHTFLRKTAETQFLFDSDIKQYQDFFSEKILDIWHSAEMINNNASKQRSKQIDEHHTLQTWCSEELKSLPDIFSKYLDVSKLGLLEKDATSGTRN